MGFHAGKRDAPLAARDRAEGFDLLARDLNPCAANSDARRAEARSMDQGEQATGGETPQTAPGTDQQVGEPKPTEPVIGGVRHTRISGAWTAVAGAALLGVALIVFIVQNTQKVQVKFFGASAHLPLVVALLAAAIIGALIVLVVGISRVTQLRLSARRRSKRTKEAENYPSSP